MSNEREIAYIIRNINDARGFDCVDARVEYHDDESIHVIDADRTYTCNVTSDDDYYYFVNDDDPNETIEFRIETVLQFHDDHLAALIRAQTQYVINELTRCQIDDRLAMMNTDDDDYVPSALNVLDALLQCKIGHAVNDIHEIDLAEMPHGADCMAALVEQFTIHPK